jgi:hypothetical protein
VRKLPTQITIAGQDIKIVSDPLHYEKYSEYGSWHPKDNEIRIQEVTAGFSKDVVFATYAHECFHAILDLSGHTELSSDEAFVERIGQLLHQCEKTRKYA